MYVCQMPSSAKWKLRGQRVLQHASVRTKAWNIISEQWNTQNECNDVCEQTPTLNTEGVLHLQILGTFVQSSSHFYFSICSIHCGCCVFFLLVLVCKPWSKSTNTIFTCIAPLSRFGHLTSPQFWLNLSCLILIPAPPNSIKSISREPWALIIVLEFRKCNMSNALHELKTTTVGMRMMVLTRMVT